MSFAPLRSPFNRAHIKPSIATTAATSVATTTATANGYIDTEGGYTVTAMGFVWATHTSPTLADNVVTITNVGPPNSFTGALTGLPSGTVVYVDAYATNQLGTSYGGDVSFTTSVGGVELNELMLLGVC